MNSTELMAGDVIVSCKQGVPWWNLVQRFFNWVLVRYSRRVYGPSCVFPEANHIRIVVGKICGILWVFEWTFPTAKFSIFKPWMVDPSYSKVYRYNHGFPCLNIANDCIVYDGGLYDAGQLLDAWFGFQRFFDFGKRNYFCSAGARVVQEAILRIPLFTGIAVSKTPPCSWANSVRFHEVKLNRVLK